MASRLSFSSGVNGRLSGVKLMPGISGFETCKRLKRDKLLADLPVIFMTGLSQTEHVLEGLGCGGVDYVTKPIVLDELLARIAALRAADRVRARQGRGVLVKAPKSKQDLRFDLPTIGPRTVEGAATAGLSGVAVVAGNTVVADPQAMIEAADAAGLFVTGLPS